MEPHLTEEELLSLVDRSFDANEETRLYRHLLQCDRCLEDLRFMANDRVFPVSGRLSDGERRSLVESGMFVAKEARPRTYETQPNTAAQSGRTPRRRVYRIAAIAAGLVAMVTAALIWKTQVPGPDVVVDGTEPALAVAADSISTSISEPILVAMTEYSNGQWTVMPGTEDEFEPEVFAYTYRGSGQGHDEEVVAAMNVLSKRYASDKDRSRELLYWLIGGYILNGQFDSAILVAGDLEEYPGDAELKTLCGLAAYGKGDFQSAKEWLRSAMADEGNTGVAALNLGVVLMEIDESDEALDVLRTVHESDPESRLGKRAKWLLSEYSE